MKKPNTMLITSFSLLVASLVYIFAYSILNKILSPSSMLPYEFITSFVAMPAFFLNLFYILTTLTVKGSLNENLKLPSKLLGFIGASLVVLYIGFSLAGLVLGYITLHPSVPTMIISKEISLIAIFVRRPWLFFIPGVLLGIGTIKAKKI